MSKGLRDYSVHAPEQEGQTPNPLFMEGSFNKTPWSLVPLMQSFDQSDELALFFMMESKVCRTLYVCEH